MEIEIAAAKLLARQEFGFPRVLPILLILSIMIYSCNRNKQLVGRYYIKNDKFGKALVYMVNDDGDSVGLLNNGFSAIGFNDNYIIVEVYPYSYLIVPVYKKFTYWPEKGILGPMNLKEFKKQKNKLKIKAGFTIYSN